MVRKRNKLKQSQPATRRRALSPRRAFASGLVTVAIFSGILFTVARPQPATAFLLPPVVYDMIAAQQRASKTIWDKLKDVADKIASQTVKALKISADVAYKSGLRVFLGKIAEDTATWVASGNYGQSPFFVEDGNYLEDLGNAAAGDFLDTLSKSQFGVSICDPGVAKLQIDLALRVNLNPNFCRDNCQKNYDTGVNEQSVTIPAIPEVAPELITLPLGFAKEILKTLQAEQAKGSTTTNVQSCKAMEASSNPVDLDTCVNRFTRAIDVGTTKLQSDLKLCINQCNNAKTRRTTSCTLTAISNNVQDSINQSSLSISTPTTTIRATGASLQEAFDSGDLPKIFKPTENPLGQFLTFYGETEEARVEAERKEKELIDLSNKGLPLRALISGAIKSPGFLTKSATEEGLSTKNSTAAELAQTGSPIADAFGIFTNTLTNKLIERIFSKGIADPKARSLAFSPGAIGSSSGGVAAAKERFASLGQVNLGTGGGIDILSELSACPVDPSSATAQSPSAVSANNCVIEANFRQAIEERLTVKQAMERRLLADQKVFGFDANGKEPNFRSGYPYRSLKILRKYRIIPVGWELAAQYIRDFERQNVNLGAIVQQYDNPDSPYYRLIDPNWVLKAPENICLRTGFTADVVSQEYVDEDSDEGARKNIDYSKRYCNPDSDANIGKECNCTTDPEDPLAPCESVYTSGGTAAPTSGRCTDTSYSPSGTATCAFITPREEQVQRREACVDEQTCILENDDGTCKQYGTCTEEKDTWRFNGQSCNAVYASCQTFTDSAGQNVSYVQSTLQPDTCGADNAGCQQYCTAYDYVGGKWACVNNAVANTARFDRDAQACDPSVEGCTQFLRMTTGSNLARNGDFEESASINPANNAAFSGWVTGTGTQTCGAQTFVSTQAFAGSQSARLQWLPACTPPSHTFSHTVPLGTPIADRTFTTSFYARSEGSACTVNVNVTSGGVAQPIPATLTTDWQRFTATHSWPANPSYNAETSFSLSFEPTADCTIVIDNVQVEEGSQVTDFKAYGAVNQAHLKRPADGLLCTGNLATDPPACSNFISKCTADDVGCDLFTPTSGGTPLPAKGGISCPADKAGCATFREQPIVGVLQSHPTRTGMYCKNFMATEMRSCSSDLDCGGNAGDCAPLVSFIAQSGTQCTAQDVGCEAFTNLDQVAQGGEGKAQFTKLQLCVQPTDTDVRSYYAWVGDNETGYQLKQYRLKVTNVLGSGAPCTNLATGQTLPLTCIDNTTPETAVINCQAEFGTNPDCGQYYDGGGTVYYRLRSRLIEATADCHPYRNTVDNLVYYADGTKSLSCSAAAVGCREYVGNTGSNTRTVISSDFENGTRLPWWVNEPANPNNESITLGGHSLYVTGSAPVAQTLDTTFSTGKTYVLSFWARGEAPTTLSANLGGLVDLGQVQIGSDWNAYTLGPGQFTTDASGVQGVAILGVPDENYFLDNIVLTEITDSTYRIKASQTACGGFEGCQEYRNRSNVVNTYSGFTKLCKSEVVGCEALINTRNSTSAFSSTTTFTSQRGDVDSSGRVDSADLDYLNAFVNNGGPAPFPLDAGDVNAQNGVDGADVAALSNFLNTGAAMSTTPYAGDTITTEGDVIEFWVNDPAKACRAEEKGCRALGRQAFDSSGNLQSMETTHLLDNPDAYATIMCGRGALFCEEYTVSDGGKAYFRNPGTRVCSYRDASGNKAAGWYIEGTETVCPTRELNHIPPAIPTGGYAGLCPEEQKGCGNFLDPIGTGSSLTTNGAFEVGTGVPQGWTAGYCSNSPGTQCVDDTPCGTGTCTTSGSVIDYAQNQGSQAVRAVITGQGTFTQTVNLDANTYYVLSANVTKGTAAMTDDFRFGVVSCRNPQNNAVSVYSPDNSMLPESTGATLRIPHDRFSDTVGMRVSGRFYSGSASSCTILVGATGGTAGYWLDNLMLTPTTNTSVIRQSVDSTSCNGQVGDKLGCRLFNDRSNTTLTYDADQSPVGGSPADPDSTGGPASCADHPELCDSNTLLKVQRDRQCTQWLTPTTTIESTKPNGQKENLTLGLATCDSFSPSGQCNHWVDEMRCSNRPKQTCVQDTDCPSGGVCIPMPLTGNTQAYSREDLRNKSGLVMAGLQWSSTQIVKGNFPYGVAPEVGNDGVAVPDDVLNGGFDQTPTIQNSGWSLASVSGSDGSNVAIVNSETLQTGNAVAPIKINPYALLTPFATGSQATVLRTTDDALSGRLTTDRSYMLSFTARYVRAPDRTVTDPALSAGIATQASTSIVSTNAWFGKVTPTTLPQRYVVGPLQLSDGNCAVGECATLSEGNIAGTSHLGFDPNTGIVYFSLDSSNRTPLIIDDVSLLPTLNVNDPQPATSAGLVGQSNGEAYIARTCRAYPNSSALACSYEDDTGKQFDGWQGYCLEPDPRNPNVCLNWYPVDLLGGARNIFGKVEAVGYSDKAPLFMCLRAKGNYNPAQITSAYVRGPEAEGAAGEQPGSPLLNQTFAYRKFMTTNMGFGAGIGAGSGASSPGVGYTFGLLNPFSSGSLSAPASASDHEINKSEIEKVALLFQWGESDRWIPTDGSACYHDNCTTHGPSYSGATPDGQAYMVFNQDAEGSCLTNGVNCWSATWRSRNAENNNYNYITFSLHFDSNGNVSSYSIYADDATDVGGFAFAVVYYMREMCTEVVKVVDTGGENAAWSSNVTSSGYVLPNFRYKLPQDDAPFGSIAPPAESFDNPAIWDGLARYTGNQMLEVKQNTVSARAGSAFACSGNCSGRQCFGLPATALDDQGRSYSCNTVADIQACTSAGGYCNGFGTAKLCVAGPRATPATPVACSNDAECGASGKCDYAGSYCSVATSGVTVGTACTTNTDCGASGVCTSFTNTSGGVYASNRATNDLAINRLKLIFANVYGAWQWSGSEMSGAYASQTASLVGSWQAAYAAMQLCNGSSLDRGLAESDPARAYCGVLPEVSNVFVGTQDRGDIIVNNGEMLQLRFNTFVDSQQLPLKQIAIDWNGDQESDEVIPWGFGPRGDRNDPHAISHAYRAQDASQCYDRGEGPYGDPDSDQYKPQLNGHDYCVATPGVQIQDNWHFCNGDTSNPRRCLTQFPVPNDENYWQPYNGTIIIVR